MRITRVGYGRLENTGNFSNARAYAEADVQEGESYEDVYESLKVWITHQLRGPVELQQEIEDLADQKSRLALEMRQKQEQLESMRSAWNKAKQFLDTLGIDSQLIMSRYDDVPF